MGANMGTEQLDYTSMEDLIKKMLSDFKDDMKSMGHVNIIIAGKTGVGKSTLINAAFRDHLAETGSGRPITQACQLIEKDGVHYGVEAVIDKDLASAMTAIKIGADEFYILTDVPKVYINFRKENEKALDTITVAEAKQYLAEGHFTEGSMAPKIRAAVLFVEATGHEAIITEATKLGDPTCGTRIVV